MADKIENQRWKTIYTSGIRHHTKNYPYKISLEDRGYELVIHHLNKRDGEWTPTHGIGLTRKDLSKMLNAIEKNG